MGLCVKLWGVRGSLPAPYPPEYLEEIILNTLQNFAEAKKALPNLTPKEFVQNASPKLGGFGGHTACFEVFTPRTQIFIDGGSGLRRAGEQLMLGSCGAGRGEVHIFMTHFHWDHLIGLPFFTPIFVPGNKIHFYAVQNDLEENVRRIFCKPNFPVAYNHLAAKIEFHQLQPRQPFKLGDITVTPYRLDHPDECWGYKMTANGRTLSHCVDSETTRVSREDLDEDLPLYQDVDVMIFDAQYTFLEAAERINWGHGSGPVGIDIALREKIKRVLFIHHDPAASNEKILAAEQQTRNYYDMLITNNKNQSKPIFECEWQFARESMVIEV
jgi:phosphoribosyl 1,2-cyclic phosphodiesterase